MLRTALRASLPLHIPAPPSALYLTSPRSFDPRRLDFCRYIFLHKFGGIYHDADYTLELPILNYVPDGVGVVESPYRYNEDVQNR